MDREKKAFLQDLGERIKKFLPDENAVGQPFWGLMEIVKGKVTGSFFVIPGSSQGIKMAMPLFFSKKEAEVFLSSRTDSEKRCSVHEISSGSGEATEDKINVRSL